MEPAPAVAWKDLFEAERQELFSWKSLPLPVAPIDAIVLTNCIHWLSPHSTADVLKAIEGALKPQGSLVIVDSFVDTANSASQFLLDWLTHGGLHWRRLHDLKEQLRQAGFSRMEATPIGEGAIQLVTCLRPAQQQQPVNSTSVKRKHE